MLKIEKVEAIAISIPLTRDFGGSTYHVTRRCTVVTRIYAGGLVSDEIMIGIIDERLKQDDAVTRGYILDGFPRTVPQASALDHITAELPIDAVLDLDVPRDMVLQRLSSRRVCRDCGTNYVASGAEKQPWICEVCGGDVMQRDDDTPEAIIFLSPSQGGGADGSDSEDNTDSGDDSVPADEQDTPEDSAPDSGG